MGIIDFTLENGICTINNKMDYQKIPVILTEEEAVAVNIIYTAVSSVGITPEQLQLERRTKNYLSIVLNSNNDFCRLKIGARTNWFSLNMISLDRKALDSDPRLDAVQNKSQFHWKISIGSASDIANYSDLIQKSCLAASR